MKKILLLVVFITGALFVNGQSSAQVEKLQNKEMDALTKIVTYNNQDIAFNKNQIAKLERLFFKKATDIVKLREANVVKEAYLSEFTKIEARYAPKVEAILTTEQKVEYRRNKNKQIKKLVD